MKKALSNSKIITLLIAAIIMISAFAMGSLSLNKNAYADQRYQTIANDNFETLNTDTWAVDGDGFAVSNGSLKLEGGSKGDKIVSKKVVSTDTSIISDMTVISAKFYAKYYAGTPRFVFGLDANGNVTENTFIVQFVGEYQGYKCVARILAVNLVDGQLKEEALNVVPFNTIDKGANLEIRVNKNQTLSIFENGAELIGTKPITVGIDSYAGACGFVANSASDRLILDDVNIVSSTYYVPTSKSVSTNFSDNYHGAPISSDFVFKAADATKFAIKNGSLVYADSNVSDYIGSSFEYDAFIVDYKIIGISALTAENAWIGVDFGRATKDAAIGENATLAFNLVGGGDAFLANGEGTVNVVKQIPAALFANATYAEGETVSKIKASDVINVRIIAEGSTISLYIRPMGDINYTLYATVEDVEISGYVGLVTSNGTYMTLDDFAIVNQSAIYNVPTNEAPEKVYDIIPLRHDYNKYRDNPENLKEELNYLNGYPGTSSSIVGAIAIPSAILICAVAAAIIVKKAKESK